jgi:hypothetical protein
MLLKGVTVAVAALALSLPVALAAGPVRIAPGERVDLKVLLISADGTEPGFGAWKAELDREGLPYDTLVAFNGQTRTETLTDDRLADYGANHARYQAVILTPGDLGHGVTNPGATSSNLSAFTDAEWATLAKFERTFGIRRLSDFTAPSPAHGLTTAVNGLKQDGLTGTLTDAGRAAFPYLKGPVAIADDDPSVDEAFGYQAAPDPAQAGAWQTLLAGPNNTAYLGVYTHPDDGREEMVMTVASNQFQNHNQLLRDGMLNWVTRGVFLGYERNYLELDIDDIFLPDDKWDAAANATDYRPEVAIRMTAADVANAVAWQHQTGLRMNMVYNMGGIAEFGAGDLLAALTTNKNEFRWINHTLQHPNLDCSTTGFTANQFTANQAQFDAQLKPGLAAGLNDPSELVSGEHSGLANTRPGNPGTLDPPVFSDQEAAATGGTLAAGTYEYGVTASTAAGETPASLTQVIVAGTTSSVTLSWPSVCWAVSYKLYRRPANGAWSLLANSATDATIHVPTPAFADAGAADVTFVDSGATAGSAATPPAANGAAIAPYRQNPAFVPALTAAGIRTIASDASKAYPNPPDKNPVSELDPTNFPKGATFPVGPAQAVPRYPSNLYYNVASRADQLDEYNWIYVKPANGGGCVDIPNVTTCRTVPATWDEYLTSETRIMFQHLTGNDPRPHYFHQTNIALSDLTKADTDTTVGGTLYAAINTLLKRYDAAYDRLSTPIVQLTQAQIAQTLVQQGAWSAARANVSAWVQDGRVYVRNGGPTAVMVPLTGTAAGEDYAGQRSGWVAVDPGATATYTPLNPANTAAPAAAGTPRVGETLTAAPGTWTGSPSLAYQWQRCASACANVAGATDSTYALTDADKDATMRVAVLAGNWVSSVSQAFSAPTTAVAAKPVEKSPEDARKGDDTSGHGGSALKLTKLKMSPRRFAVAHKRLPKGTKLDGSRISWKLSRAATVTLTFQRHTHKGWQRIGAIRRAAKAGTGVVRFRGRFGSKLLKPQRYRLVVSASGSGHRTGARRLSFRVLKG